jgi:methyl-accepting chemotaxis protein-1 (serine sensor receptor)
LKAQALALVEAVAVFKLSGGGARSHTPAPTSAHIQRAAPAQYRPAVKSKPYAAPAPRPASFANASNSASLPLMTPAPTRKAPSPAPTAAKDDEWESF